MDLQKKNNGFVSCFVLALGLTVLMIAMGSARLAQDQLKEAEAYCDTVTAAYYAENLLHLYWDEMSAQPCRAMPLSEKKDAGSFIRQLRRQPTWKFIVLRACTIQLLKALHRQAVR